MGQFASCDEKIACKSTDDLDRNELKKSLAKGQIPVSEPDSLQHCKTETDLFDNNEKSRFHGSFILKIKQLKVLDQIMDQF